MSRRAMLVVCARLAARVGATQLPAAQRLGGPVERRSHEFTSITSVRELRDGRVLVTDPRGDFLGVADFAADEVTAVGRKGRGPGEYESVFPVLPRGDDSSLVALATNRRWLLLHGARIVATLATDAPLVGGGLIISGADSLGHALTLVGPRPKHGVQEYGPADSLTLVLLNRRTGQGDSVGRVRRAAYRVEAQLDGDGRVRSITSVIRNPLELAEPSVLFADGWIAVVRRDPYRVDWRAPTGGWRVGAPIPYERVRVDRREREAAMRYHADQFGGTVSSPDRHREWPDVLPAVAPSRLFAVVATPEGAVAVRRARSARAPEPVYDVVDREGRVARRIVLAADEAIVALGRGRVYVARTDADGGAVPGAATVERRRTVTHVRPLLVATATVALTRTVGWERGGGCESAGAPG